MDGQVRLTTHASDLQRAEDALQQYLAGKANPKAPASPRVEQLMDAYRDSRCQKLRNNAANEAERAARDRGVEDEDAIRQIRARAEATVQPHNIGSVIYPIQNLKRHLGGLLVWQINSGVARQFERMRRAERANNARAAKAAGRRIRGNGGLADASIAKDLVILRAALAWAEKEDAHGWFGPTEKKPTFEMPVTGSSEPRHLVVTKEQAAALIQAAPMFHLKLFLRIGFVAGARKEAIEKLRWDMVDFDEGKFGSINFGAVEHRKKRPWIGMTPELRDHMLAAYKVRCSDFVIEYRGKKAGDVKNGIKSAASKAGIPWFTSVS